MILPARKRAASVAIHRYGNEGEILEPTPGAATGYGKTSDPTWAVVAEESIVLSYQRGSEPTQTRYPGGRYRSDSPFLFFMADSAVEEGFRVRFQIGERTSVYEVDSLTFYPSHIEGETTVVS